MRLIRVFPRRTKASPTDDLAYFGPPDLFAEADAVHVSVSFSWDIPAAERLADQWRDVAPVTVGGVAYGDRGDEFVSGRYVREGYTFTSRGCPRRCWFCSVWKRDPTPRLLPIVGGWNILDDNLLACPRHHVETVFAMLARQGRQAQFTGGLEALSLQDYQVDLLASLRPRPDCFFAYHRLRCYVLVGFPQDTMDAADGRLARIQSVGYTPMAMLWRPETASAQRHAPGPEWRKLQRRWARPAIIHARAA